MHASLRKRETVKHQHSHTEGDSDQLRHCQCSCAVPMRSCTLLRCLLTPPLASALPCCPVLCSHRHHTPTYTQFITPAHCAQLLTTASAAAAGGSSRPGWSTAGICQNPPKPQPAGFNTAAGPAWFTGTRGIPAPGFWGSAAVGFISRSSSASAKSGADANVDAVAPH